MEGDAGTSQLNPTDADAAPDDAAAKPDGSLAVSQGEPTAEATAEEFPEPGSATEAVDAVRPSRIGRGLAVTICAALLVLAAGGAVGGYLALRSHQQSESVARAEASALQAAKDCVAATHAPDTAAMSAAQSKIIECATGDFGAQASLYAGVMVDAYQAADVKVAVSDIRAAVEKRNDDGSFEILVAVRVKVTNSEEADREQGYRLRVQMAPDQGTYKVARLDQVSSS
jgi:Mce-associated membrane protein